MAKTKEEIDLIVSKIEDLLKDLDGEDIVKVGKQLAKYKELGLQNEVSVNFEEEYEVVKDKDLPRGFNNY